MSNYRDLVATIGRYEKDGQTKYVTRKVGTLLETDKGTRIKLDASFNPAGCIKGEDGGVWLAAFDPKPREQTQQPSRNGIIPERQQPAHSGAGEFIDFDSDIPFAGIDKFLNY